MKKLLFLPILMLSLNLLSQENWETTFKTGINCSFLSKGVSYSGNKVFIGVTGGLEQTYYFDNSIFSVQSGLEFDYIGTGISTYNVTSGNSNPAYGTLSRSNSNYLSIPLHLKCMINPRWGALAGATYRFAVSSGQSGSSTGNNDASIDAGFFYKMKNMRFNLVYQHGLSEGNSSSQMIQSKNRTITFSVSAPLWNM
ncbi:MAG TPA: hypothetical protein VFC41_09740 [Anaerovoracaceae bacterium]|nr:hypothetical protein [Anaerovoracaceae bacterium]